MVFFPVEMVPNNVFFWSGILDVRILDFVPLRGNARFYQCMLDEDMIRRDSQFEFDSHFFDVQKNTTLHPKKNWTTLQESKVKAILTGVHPLVFSERGLQHYCAFICLRWAGIVNV